jgi:hypothetical protein
VSKEYFDEVCPENERTIIRSDEVKDFAGSSAIALVDEWVKRLNSSGRCVEVDKTSLHIFDIWQVHVAVNDGFA